MELLKIHPFATSPVIDTNITFSIFKISDLCKTRHISEIGCTSIGGNFGCLYCDRREKCKMALTYFIRGSPCVRVGACLRACVVCVCVTK